MQKQETRPSRGLGAHYRLANHEATLRAPKAADPERSFNGTGRAGRRGRAAGMRALRADLAGYRILRGGSPLGRWIRRQNTTRAAAPECELYRQGPSSGRRRPCFRSAIGCTSLGGAFAALVGAVIALGFAGTVLSAVSEDVISSNGLETRDPANLQFVTDHRSSMLVAVARVVTQLGGVGVLIVVALGAGLFLWFRGARLVLAAAPLFALLTAGALAGVGKVLVARTRPPAQFRLIPESDASFPSGHSTDSAALYLTLGLIVAVVLLRRPLARVAMVVAAGLIAVGVGVSRLVLGVHWQTDVLAGWALGATVAVIVGTGALLASHLAPAGPSAGAGDRRRMLELSRRMLVWQRPTVHRVTA